MTALVILAAMALLIVFWAVGAYQRLSSQRIRCKTTFTQVDALLKRRCELIPNLVETSRGYMKDERNVFEAVIAAGNAAIAAHTQAGGNALDPFAVARMVDAENLLDAALADMLALLQGCPELLSDQNMQRIAEELTSAEQRIGFVRQVYHEAATQYNTSRMQFPGSIIAFVFGFSPAGELQAGMRRA